MFQMLYYFLAYLALLQKREKYLEEWSKLLKILVKIPNNFFYFRNYKIVTNILYKRFTFYGYNIPNR